MMIGIMTIIYMVFIMTKYFTSDWHLNHKRLLEFGHRPFKTNKENEETLINNWNKKVKDNDTVFILGDFIFSGGVAKKHKIYKQLKGNKVYIAGNHDFKLGDLLGGYIEMLGGGWELVHNPDDSSASKVIHGHIHLPNAVRIHKQKNGRLFVNVNCELWDYSPVSIKQISKEVKKLK